MKAGRPKAGLETMPKNWEYDILALYAEGASDVEVQAWIHNARGTFSIDLFYRWLEEEPRFSETIKKGRRMAQAWWEKHGRKQLGNKDFNHILWYMNMKNRYKWTDRQEIDHNIKDYSDMSSKLRDLLN